MYRSVLIHSCLRSRLTGSPLYRVCLCAKKKSPHLINLPSHNQPRAVKKIFSAPTCRRLPILRFVSTGVDAGAVLGVLLGVGGGRGEGKAGGALMPADTISACEKNDVARRAKQCSNLAILKDKIRFDGFCCWLHEKFERSKLAGSVERSGSRR